MAQICSKMKSNNQTTQSLITSTGPDSNGNSLMPVAASLFPENKGLWKAKWSWVAKKSYHLSCLAPSNEVSGYWFDET